MKDRYNDVSSLSNEMMLPVFILQSLGKVYIKKIRDNDLDEKKFGQT